jgi:plasmid maintenance system antidote protein VapI
MNSNHLPNIHPGEILKLDFLEPLNITARKCLPIPIQN